MVTHGLPFRRLFLLVRTENGVIGKICRQGKSQQNQENEGQTKNRSLHGTPPFKSIKKARLRKGGPKYRNLLRDTASQAVSVALPSGCFRMSSFVPHGYPWFTFSSAVSVFLKNQFIPVTYWQTRLS
jgi:hypothetical protein